MPALGVSATCPEVGELSPGPRGPAWPGRRREGEGVPGRGGSIRGNSTQSKKASLELLSPFLPKWNTRQIRHQAEVWLNDSSSRESSEKRWDPGPRGLSKRRLQGRSPV